MDIRLALLATALLFPAPWVAGVVARKPATEPFDELRRAHASLRAIRVARAHLCVLASYAVILWICQGGSLIDARSFVLAYTVMIVTACAAYLPWLRRLERVAHERSERSRASIQDLKRAAGW